MFGPDEDYGFYEDYEASPYNGDDQDGFENDLLDDVEDALDEDEPTDEEIAEWEAEEERGGEDAFLDSVMEDRISGFSGFEFGE